MRAPLTMLTAVGLALLSLAGCAGPAAPPSDGITIALSRLGFLVPNPLRESGGSMDYLNLLYDPLVGTNGDGTLSRESGIAEDWELSPDGLTWTFHLRKGVKFHDGVELTAEDVKFSMEAAVGPASRSTYAAEVKERLESIEVTDPYTVVVHCRKPWLALAEFYANRSGFILPKHYYETVGDEDFTRKPVGSGPYRFVSVLVGSQITLEATEHHWRDGKPRFNRVTFMVIGEESTSLAMLTRGAADITVVGRDKVELAQNAGLQIIEKTNAAIVNFRPNMQWTSPAFSDIRFRKALNLAVDKASIMKNIFNGRATPATTWPGSVIGVAGEVPALEPYGYDPDEARRLIKEAGFEGYAFKVPSYQRSFVPEFPRLVETIAGYWEKVGLKPTIYNTDFATFQAAWRAGKTQGNVMGVDGVTDPNPFEILNSMKLYLHSSSSRTLLHDPQLDAMLDKASASLDRAFINKSVIDVYQRLYDQYYFIPICEIDEIIATTQRIPRWDAGRLSQEHNFIGLIRQP